MVGGEEIEGMGNRRGRGERKISQEKVKEKKENFFFNDTATAEIYTLALHDALPISGPRPSMTVHP